MSQTSMRSRSPQEEIRTLENELNGPDQPARLLAARRLNEIALGSPPESRERTLAVNALAARLPIERDMVVRRELERTVSGLRREHSTGASVPAETRQQPEADAGISERIAGVVASRILGPIAIIPRLAGCATEYEGSVMEGETGLVREFTEGLVRGETTIEGRVRRIVAWGQANLPHYHGEYSTDVYGHSETEMGAMETSIVEVFRERVVGCHLAVFTLVTMLRSIGIDAEYVRSESLGLEGEEARHGILYIPQIDRYVHGDSVCITNLLPTENIIVDRETVSSIVRAQIEARGASSGGFLRRDGNSLFIEGGVVHTGHEDTEFPRLQALFPDYEITPGPPAPNGFGTTFTTRHVPIVPLD